MNTLLRSLLLILLLGSLFACASKGGLDEDIEDLPVDQLYAEAKRKLDNGLYESAIEYYETLESRYPYGVYAEQAQLEVAYAYYKFNEPESAILAAERFIKLHPNHKDVDYAYYLRGLASHQEMGALYRFFKQDNDERDPAAANRAFRYFQELVKRFPKSKYTPEAVARMTDIRESLARHEIFVIDYYVRRRAYVAVSNRAKYVIRNFQGTSAVPDALGAMVNAYYQLGLNQLAIDAYRILKLNYPDHAVTRQVAKLPVITPPAKEPDTNGENQDS